VGKKKNERRSYPISKDPGLRGFPRPLRPHPHAPAMDSIRVARMKRQSPKAKPRTLITPIGRRQRGLTKAQVGKMILDQVQKPGQK
jgi:hypothetical protein